MTIEISIEQMPKNKQHRFRANLIEEVNGTISYIGETQTIRVSGTLQEIEKTIRIYRYNR